MSEPKTPQEVVQRVNEDAKAFMLAVTEACRPVFAQLLAAQDLLGRAALRARHK